MFDMKGKKILLLSARVIPEMFQEFQEKSGISKDAVDYIIPHQASRALPFVMDKLGVSKDKYLNIVSEYGNMVSVAVPFGLAYALDHGYVKEGDTIFLMGTAAGWYRFVLRGVQSYTELHDFTISSTDANQLQELGR